MTHEYERVETPSSGLRLHLNENTLGCSTAVVESIQRLTRQHVAEYPDYDAAVRACAARLDVERDSLILTNGLDEGILAASIVALRNGPIDAPYEAIVVVPAFDMYAACAEAAGGRVVEIPLGPGFEFPVDRILAAIGARTRIVWLTNPNNPTGQRIPRQAILAITAAAAGAMVVVDEAYADFSGETFLSDRPGWPPNLIVGRTFAKAYGLAGLRIGALVGDPAALEPLRRVVPPYSLNVCAAAALPAAMRDTSYYAWYLEQVAQSKALLYAEFDRLGVTYWTSAANFVLARFEGRGRAVASALAERGVHVRDRSRDEGCMDCLRITAGIVEHTSTFITALREVL